MRTRSLMVMRTWPNNNEDKKPDYLRTWPLIIMRTRSLMIVRTWRPIIMRTRSLTIMRTWPHNNEDKKPD